MILKSINPNEINFHADLDFHKSCAQIFFESELIKKLMVEKSSCGGTIYCNGSSKVRVFSECTLQNSLLAN